MKVNFNGVYKNQDKTEMAGYISSKDVILNFTPSWIPSYQRERLKSKSKISDLKKLFLANKEVPPLVLHVSKRPVQSRDNAAHFVIDGDITVVDGQQRITALFETGKEDYSLPVQIFVNQTQEETVDFFQSSNGKQTLLSLGDYIMSYTGEAGLLVQRIMKERGNWAFPMSRAQGKSGMGVSTGACLIYWTYFHLNEVEGQALIPRRSELADLFQDKTITKKEMEHVSYAYRQLAEFFVDIFGSFDHTDTAYQRTFFLAWNLLIVRNFMDHLGNISMKRNLQTKSRELRETLFKKPRFKEVSKGGVGRDMIEQMYDLLIGYFNHKVQQVNHLGTFERIEARHRQNLTAQKRDMRISKTSPQQLSLGK